jgi:Raf kinase inhibitor-like YbhB/YbcL family protein
VSATLAIASLLTCGREPASTPTSETTMTDKTLSVTSSAFAANGEIPSEYTCEGDDVSPPLSWSGAPEGTKSFALVVDDPDAPDPAKPQRVWVHWVVYDLPPTATELPRSAAEALPSGARHGNNDWAKPTWGGPCPPIGRHRYFHKIYALDTMLGDLGSPTKADLERAMKGHVLAQGELVGTYQKRAK